MRRSFVTTGLSTVPGLMKKTDWFADQPTLADTIRNAALARDWRGKRLIHQSRLRLQDLKEAESCLLSAEKQIQSCRTFDELHHMVCACVKRMFPPEAR